MTSIIQRLYRKLHNVGNFGIHIDSGLCSFIEFIETKDQNWFVLFWILT